MLLLLNRHEAGEGYDIPAVHRLQSGEFKLTAVAEAAGTVRVTVF
jgi:hypothetical protein